MKITRINRKLDDLIHSKHHNSQLAYFSGAPLRCCMKYIKEYENLRNSIGEDLFVVFSGKSELIKYAKDIYSLETLGEDECICISFEDFSAYYITVQHTRNGSLSPIQLTIVLTDKKQIILPRVKRCELEDVSRKVEIIDNTSGSLYILPKLYYPKGILDKRNLFRWLRINKQLLCIRYKYTGESRVRFYPGYQYRWNRWYKVATIIDDSDTDKCVESYSSLYPTIVDYTKSEISSSLFNTQPTNGVKVIEILDTGEITQDIINEFVERENNRYRIITR